MRVAFGLVLILVLGAGIFFVLRSERMKSSETMPAAEGGEFMMEEEDRLRLASPAFNDQGQIPAKYTCDGSALNPPLQIQGVPPAAQSLVLIVDDPDAPAGIWYHWLLFNIAADITEIGEGVGQASAQQGLNSFGNLDYGGPCPPPGPAHRYQFNIYALDTRLNLPDGTSHPELVKAIQGHILAQAQLTGLYQRK